MLHEPLDKTHLHFTCFKSHKCDRFCGVVSLDIAFKNHLDSNVLWHSLMLFSLMLNFTPASSAIMHRTGFIYRTYFYVVLTFLTVLIQMTPYSRLCRLIFSVIELVDEIQIPTLFRLKQRPQKILLDFNFMRLIFGLMLMSSKLSNTLSQSTSNRHTLVRKGHLEGEEFNSTCGFSLTSVLNSII